MGRKDASRTRITKAAVAALVAPDGAEAWLWDTEVRNFGVRRSGRTQRAVYLIRYRNRHGRQRKHTIGRVEDWTPAQARTRAQELFRTIAGGADPAAQRETDREAPTITRLMGDGSATSRYGEGQCGDGAQSRRDGDPQPRPSDTTRGRGGPLDRSG